MTITEAGANASRTAESPSRRNAGPARTSVSTILAEDVVLGHTSISVLDKAPVALFANPYREGAEEFCTIDRDGTLTYVHRTPEGHGWAQEGFEGWSKRAVTGMVTAVHPDGSVWLFVGSGVLDAFELRQGSTWEERPSESIPAGWTSLSVHYLPDRPATPCIVGLDLTRTFLQVLAPRFATPDDPRRWERTVAASLPSPLPDVFFAGLQGNGTLRVYAYDGTSITRHSYAGAWEPDTVVVSGSTGSRLLAGLWNAPEGLGCVFIDSAGHLRAYTPSGTTWGLQTAEQFSNAATWQDDRGLLHVYATSPDQPGVLQVIHQRGWTAVATPTWAGIRPVFVTAPHNNRVDTVVSLPLVSQVGGFLLDPAPDAYPSQLLMPADKAAPYRVASQDVTTAWWSEEQVTLPGGGVASLQRRHICDVTVLDGFGAPLPSWPVQLSSQTTVDVDIAGRMVRLGPSDTAHVLTDEVGKLSLRVTARGLTVPTIQVTAKGMAEGASIDAAGGVQAFLAGTGVLAAHPEALAADQLLNATVGDSWLVPGWHPKADDALGLPTAQQVVDSCASVFAQTRGAPAGPGFVVQRTDAGQPAYRLLEPGESPLEALGGSDASDVSPFLHDLWRGIRDGVLGVTGYSTTGTGTFTIQCLAPGGVALQAVYALRTDADAALAVEAIFQQLDAGVDRLVEWLAWAIPFKEIWNTATALSSALDGFPAVLSAVVKHYQELVKPNWFTDHQQQAVDALAAVREQVRGRSVDGLSGAGGLVSDLPAPLYQPDTVVTPASTWFHDLLARESSSLPPARSGDADPVWDPLWRTFTDSVPGKSFKAAFDKASADLLALWDLDDSRAVPGTPLQGFVDIVGDVLPQALALADVAFPKALSVMTSVSTSMKTSLAEPLVAPGLNDFYAWFQRQAGVPAGQEAPLTKGGLGALYAAYPTTGAYLTVLGSPPFPTARFPSYTVPWKDGPGVGNDWRALCLGIQVFAGLAQILYTGIDVFLDVRQGSQWVSYGIALFELIGFGLAGIPEFYDTPADARLADRIAWAQYALWLWLYVMDFWLSFEAEESTLLTMYSGRAGNVILFLVGVAQVALAGAAYAASDQTELDQDWLSAAVGASLSTVTAPLRLLHNLPPTPLRDTGIALKVLIDVFADMYSGWKYVALPAYQIGHPVVITTTNLTAATVGQDYNATVTATKGCPPYTWGLEGTLPGGIEFDKTTGTFSGKPAAGTNGSYELYVVVTDYYPPPSKAGVTLTLEVHATGDKE